MNGTDLRFDVALGAMRLVSEMQFGDVVRSLGITETEYKRLVGDAPWVGTDRHTMGKALNALATGILDITGTPRFELPAEYYASVIAVFVSPTNTLTACRWIDRPVSHEELMGASTDRVPVKPEVVFGLILKLYNNDGCNAIRDEFEKQVNFQIKKAERAA